MNLRNKIWLWGQKPSGYDAGGYNLPVGKNKMTPTEGLSFFGINNLCRVKLSAEAGNSFFDDPWLGGAEKLCLSLIGAGGEVPRADIDDVLKIGAKDQRLVSTVMDDFVSEKRLKHFTPQLLSEYSSRLHSELDRPIEMWSVLYERDFDVIPKDRARIFDVTTFWTWYGEHLADYSENLKRISDIVDGGRIMLGVYMYDFGNCRPLDTLTMERQLDFVTQSLSDGKAEGAILCSNVIADIGLPTVDVTLRWLDTLSRCPK